MVMKSLSMIAGVLSVSFSPSMVMAEQPNAIENAQTITNAPNEIKGRVHRLSIQAERESVAAVSLAKQLYNQGIYDSLTDEEVRAVGELAFVQDAARDFRNAVARENYTDNPVLSRQAYLWLHRAFQVVERDYLITGQPQLKGGPVAQLERTMHQLRKFYTLAERLGWSLAEVTLLAEELEEQTGRVYDLALRETDNRREGQILQLLAGLKAEADQFGREARSVRRQGSARVILGDNFRRLQVRFAQVDRLMDDPRFVRFSHAVKQAYAEVESTYNDIVLSFTGNIR